MKLLNELVNPNTIQLTNTQMGVLCIIKTSPTPEVAYENITGTENVMSATQLLQKLGIVSINGNAAYLTQTGEEIVLKYDLVDETGKLTERGKGVMETLEADKQQYQMSEAFSLIKTL
jgi:predicted methyltransferase